MPRPRIVLSLVAVTALASGTAVAESYPRPASCDASTVVPAFAELPVGCPLATFAPVPPSDRPFEMAPEPIVFVSTGSRSSPASVAIASSWTTMRGHISYCAPYTCSDQVIDGDLEAVRYDIVFLQPPPVGSTVEISGGGRTRQVRVVAAGACPAVVTPSVTCELPRCGEPDAHCMRQEPHCDGGVRPYPLPDAGPDAARDAWSPEGDGYGSGYPHPYPDEVHDHHRGCSTADPTAASPLLLAWLAFVMRRRRR